MKTVQYAKFVISHAQRKLVIDIVVLLEMKINAIFVMLMITEFYQIQLHQLVFAIMDILKTVYYFLTNKKIIFLKKLFLIILNVQNAQILFKIA